MMLTDLMTEAVQHSIRHVAGGGLPFVGVVTGEDGYVSDPGVNQVMTTGDPTAHAEIVAIRTATQDLGRTNLKGMVLLATGEPCGMCYRVAFQHGISDIRVAVTADEVATYGIDYRGSYLGIDRKLLDDRVTALPVPDRLVPFRSYLARHTSPTPQKDTP